MKKFNKKRIVFILVWTFLPIGIFMLQTANNNLNQKTVATMSVPVTNRTIIVDAGHGGEDGGAVSSNGVSEAQINLSIALKLQNLLEQSGATVVLTRSDDNAIYEMLRKIFSGEIDYISIKKKILQRDYSNREEIMKIYELLK